jgi:hypothetical protein
VVAVHPVQHVLRLSALLVQELAGQIRAVVVEVVLVVALLLHKLWAARAAPA